VFDITVFEGRWQIVPRVDHSVREGAPSFAPRVWRLEPRVLVIVAAQHSALNDARPRVEISGAAGTPLEEDQVGVLEVHGHRHHHLLVHRRQLPAVDEVEGPLLQTLQLVGVLGGGRVPGGQSEGHDGFDQRLIGHSFDPGGATMPMITILKRRGRIFP